MYLQTDGNRIHKDLRNYISAVRGETGSFFFFFFNFVPVKKKNQTSLTLSPVSSTDMREASRRLSQSLFDVYENDWAGEEDLGAIVEVRRRASVIIIRH